MFIISFKEILRILPPGKEKNLPIQGRKRFADHLHGRLGHLVIEAKLSSLMGGFPDNHAVFGNGVHGPCHNLAGSQRGMGRDVSKFRDMQKLKCAAAERCAGCNFTPIGKRHRRFGRPGLNLPFDEAS